MQRRWGSAGRLPGRWLDPIQYAVSALLAAIIGTAAGIPPYREWVRIAIVAYAVGAVAAVAIGIAVARRAGAAHVRARVWLAIAVFAGAALVPMAVEAARRSDAMGLHAQSEVIITEEAAKALLDGRDPYATAYVHGPLFARPLATKTHYAYLPGMIAFGLPRALDGRSPLADARVWFAAVAVAAMAGALLARRREPLPAEGRILAFQVLAVLPTGALAVATGGDDIPVLALMLLSLVLLRDRRPVTAGLAAGAAAGLKQTAWVLLPLLILATPPGRERRNAALAAGAVALPVVLPFVAWNPAAFVDDAIRYPLGLSSVKTVAATPTVGSVLIRAFPGAGGPLVVLLVAVFLAGVTLTVVRRPPRDAAGAAATAAFVLALGLLLAPAARAGYVVYPIDLAVWAFVLRSVDSAPNVATEGARQR